MNKLEKAAKLVERGWCRFFLAVDKNDKLVSVDSPEAEKFCAHGALMRAGVSISERARIAYAVTDKLGVNLVEWNNTICQDGAELAQLFRSL